MDALIWLPSGRQLTYVKPEWVLTALAAVTYEGLVPKRNGSALKVMVRSLLRTSSGPFQEISLPFHAKSGLSGLNIVMHVHDEVVLEVPLNIVQDVCVLMGHTALGAGLYFVRMDLNAIFIKINLGFEPPLFAYS